MKKWLNKIHLGHCLELLRQLPNDCIDAVITSPPYYAQRFYGGNLTIWSDAPVCDHQWTSSKKIFCHYSGETNPGKEQYFKQDIDKNELDKNEIFICKKCNGYKGELGLEPTPELYIANLALVFKEVYRILKPTGSVFCVIDDSYIGSAQGYGVRKSNENGFQKAPCEVGYYASSAGKPATLNKHLVLKRKSLCLVPQKFVVRMTELGFVIRNEIVWLKNNSLPESAKDRFTHCYEYVYFMTKKSSYYFDQQFEPLSESTFIRAQYDSCSAKTDKGVYGGMDIKNQKILYDKILKGEILERNQRDIFQVNTHPFHGEHYAVFPEKLIAMLVKAGTSEHGCCEKCGRPYKRKLERKDKRHWIERQDYKQDGKYSFEYAKTKQPNEAGRNDASASFKPPEYNFLGWHPTCKCNAGVVPAVILDPFMGAGTTAVVARKLNRNFIGFEVNKSYIKMSERRLYNEIGLFL